MPPKKIEKKSFAVAKNATCRLSATTCDARFIGVCGHLRPEVYGCADIRLTYIAALGATTPARNFMNFIKNLRYFANSAESGTALASLLADRLRMCTAVPGMEGNVSVFTDIYVNQVHTIFEDSPPAE